MVYVLTTEDITYRVRPILKWPGYYIPGPRVLILRVRWTLFLQSIRSSKASSDIETLFTPSSQSLMMISILLQLL